MTVGEDGNPPESAGRLPLSPTMWASNIILNDYIIKIKKRVLTYREAVIKIYSIDEISKLVKISADTLRYYDEIPCFYYLESARQFKDERRFAIR